jgi:hypothetical protein
MLRSNEKIGDCIQEEKNNGLTIPQSEKGGRYYED